MQYGGFLKMDDCIFCKIIKGEIPSKKVYEDAGADFVMQDIRGILELVKE